MFRCGESFWELGERKNRCEGKMFMKGIMVIHKASITHVFKQRWRCYVLVRWTIEKEKKIIWACPWWGGRGEKRETLFAFSSLSFWRRANRFSSSSTHSSVTSSLNERIESLWCWCIVTEMFSNTPITWEKANLDAREMCSYVTRVTFSSIFLCEHNNTHTVSLDFSSIFKPGAVFSLLS